MYHLTITLYQLMHLVPKRPNPDVPIDGNRRVILKRAREFGEYVLNRDDWVSPAIIVRIPAGEVDFDLQHAFEDGTAWGILRIPLHVLLGILVLDGQHRTLGTFLAMDSVDAHIKAARDAVAVAKASADDQALSAAEQELAASLNARERLNQEHISVDLAVVASSQGTQMFVDIANNAKGVNPDFTTILDQRNVINRMATELIENHPLLDRRVELGQSTRMTAKNPNFIGAKSVADIARAVNVGLRGRVGKKVEDELDQEFEAAVKRVETFLNVLMASVPELEEMVNGKIEPIELREEDSEYRSMIASATMLRVLGGTYHDLKSPSKKDNVKAMDDEEIIGFFGSLVPKMHNIPIKEDDPLWMPTGVFLPGSTAPSARQGSMSALARDLARWAREGNTLLD
jgi:hypothetical protein